MIASFRFLIVGLLFVTLPTAAKPPEFFPTRMKISLTYDQWRRLNKQDKAFYIKALRDFYGDAEKAGWAPGDVAALTETRPGGERTAALWSLLIGRVDAQDVDCNRAFYINALGQYCSFGSCQKINSSGFNLAPMLDKVPAQCASSARSALQAQITAQKEETSRRGWWDNVFVTSKLTPEQSQNVISQMTAADQKLEQRQKTIETQAADQKQNGLATPRSNPSSTLDAATQAQAVHRQQASDMIPKGEPNKNLAEAAQAETAQLTKDLACIYAGFPIRGDVCRPRDSVVTKTRDGQAKAYTCLSIENFNSTQTPPLIDEKVIAPEKAQASKAVLCNPSIFGLDKDGKPFCIGKRPDATKECRRLSELPANKDKAIEAAIRILDEDAEVTRLNNATIEHLCVRDDDSKLRAYLQGRNHPNIDRAVRDLANTCNDYVARFSEIERGLFLHRGQGVSDGQL